MLHSTTALSLSSWLVTSQTQTALAEVLLPLLPQFVHFKHFKHELWVVQLFVVGPVLLHDHFIAQLTVDRMLVVESHPYWHLHLLVHERLHLHLLEHHLLLVLRSVHALEESVGMHAHLHSLIGSELRSLALGKGLATGRSEIKAYG